jgi:DNA polymerase-4
MPAARARALCPQAVFLQPDFRRYRAESDEILAIFRSLTPVVQIVSIDEAYLDVTDHLDPWGSATAVARAVRARVRAERGLTVSVGAGPSKLVAKIASDFDKPDGLTVVSPGRVQRFLDPLPVRRLPGVGPATEKRLKELGIETVAQLREREEGELRERFGKYGGRLHAFARGIDDRPVRVHQERKSLSSETTFDADLRTLDEVRTVLDDLAASVARGLRKRSLSACTVTLKVRYADFTTVTRSQTLPAPTCQLGDFATAARLLAERTDVGRRPVRLLGVGASNLVRGEVAQLSLFASDEVEDDLALGT